MRAGFPLGHRAVSRSTQLPGKYAELVPSLTCNNKLTISSKGQSHSL
jgi:hypothetical protein